MKGKIRKESCQPKPSLGYAALSRHSMVDRETGKTKIYLTTLFLNVLKKAKTREQSLCSVPSDFFLPHQEVSLPTWLWCAAWEWPGSLSEMQTSSPPHPETLALCAAICVSTGLPYVPVEHRALKVTALVYIIGLLVWVNLFSTAQKKCPCSYILWKSPLVLITFRYYSLPFL